MCYFGNNEPPIDDLIDDDLGRLVISRSGMTPETIRALIVDAWRKQSSRAAQAASEAKEEPGVPAGII